MIATPPAAFIEFSEVLQPLLGQRVPPRDDLAAARYIFVLKCHLAGPQEKNGRQRNESTERCKDSVGEAGHCPALSTTRQSHRE